MSAKPPGLTPPNNQHGATPPPSLSADLQPGPGGSLRGRTLAVLGGAIVVLLLALNLPLHLIIVQRFVALERQEVTAELAQAQGLLVGLAADRGVSIDELTPTDLNELSRRAQIEVSLFRPGAGQPTDVLEARALLIGGTSTVVRPRDELSVAGYTLVADRQEQTLVLRIVVARTFTAQGQTIAGYVSGIVATALLVYAAVTLTLIERGAMLPLARLIGQVGRLGHNGDRGARLTVAQNDEIGQLAQAINRMLAAREQANQARIQAETEQDRLALENRLLEAQRIEGLRTMAGGIAHELNNILTIIMGSVELVKAELPTESELVAHLMRAEEATGRAGRLTAQLLAFSGRGRIYSQQLDLGQLLVTMREMLRAAVPRTVSLSYALADSPAKLEADVVQIRQLVLNLVLNAAEAMGEVGGTITIVIARRRPGQLAPDTVFRSPELGQGPYVAIEVHDTGPGIDPNSMNRLFEPFFSTGFTGRGLGLPAVLGIVRSHRGALELRSQPGVGTVVAAIFPAAETEAPPVP